MSVFKNFVLNFKSKEDCDNYVTRYNHFIPTLEGTGVQTVFVCRMTDESIFIFSTYKSEAIADKVARLGDEWRELNRFDIHDKMVLDGVLQNSWNFEK